MTLEFFTQETVSRSVEIYLNTVALGYKIGSFSREEALEELKLYKNKTIALKEDLIKEYPDSEPFYDHEIIGEIERAEEMIKKTDFNIIVIPISH